MKMNYLLIVIILMILLSVFSWAHPADSILKVKKVNDFEVKGDGASAEWNKAEWTLLKKRNGAANYKTQFKTLYSEKGIYCLFVCEDSKITSTLKEDFADIYNEDVVEVFFWTDESAPIYFEYELSPTNYELPIIVPNNKGDFFGWRPWHYDGERKTRHAARINEENGKVKSWTAEFFIPFALLKPLKNATPKEGVRWRTNFYRIDYDNSRSSWNWRSVRQNFHDYESFGVIEFD